MLCAAPLVTTIGGLTLALDILIIILMIVLTVTKTREHFIRRGPSFSLADRHVH